MKLAIAPKFHSRVSGVRQEEINQLAAEIQRENPQLEKSEASFDHLTLKTDIDDSPTLHLDDFSEIPVIGCSDNSAILQQRARLRAVAGDFVAQANAVESGFSDYCEYKLGLDRVTWLYPAIVPNDPRKIAFTCWQDRRIKHDLVHAVRHQGLRYIHPHVSTLHVWELADLLQKSTRLPISVIGPSPALAGWANDKIEFTRAAASLLGEEFVPHTECAYNFATLSKKVMALASANSRLGIKFPYGTGGNGNFLVDANLVRKKSLAQVASYLKDLLADHRWPKKGRVLVDVWESDVLSSPSVQLWLPANGAPVIEGLFRQSMQGEQGHFVGSCPEDFPQELHSQIIDASFELGLLFQQLGYVGRCSFDLILVGESLENCRYEFIECNARWGGTSGPMTLMNRMLIPQVNQTYCIEKIKLPGLNRLTFAEIRRALDADLYDATTKLGKFVLFNPARIKAHSSIDAIAMAPTEAEAASLVKFDLPERLASLIDAYQPAV